MNNANWDDLRYVLAVAETGTVSAAAQRLGVTHATVIRRIAAFEERYGQRIFQRSAKGYRVLPDCHDVIDASRRVEESVLAVERTMFGAETRLSGDVRITSTDSLCQTLLPPIVARIAKTYPALRIALLSANTHLDFARFTADITVRPAAALEDGLEGQQAGSLGFAVYHDGTVNENWLGLTGPIARSLPANWLDANVKADRIVQTSDSFLVLAELAAAGIGMAFLPCLIGDNDPRLVRAETPADRISVALWVASHAELADTVRFRVVRELLIEELAKEADVLSGAEGRGQK